VRKAQIINSKVQAFWEERVGYSRSMSLDEPSEDFALEFVIDGTRKSLHLI